MIDVGIKSIIAAGIRGADAVRAWTIHENLTTGGFEWTFLNVLWLWDCTTIQFCGPILRISRSSTDNNGLSPLFITEHNFE
jgi:hypothetical protein